MHLKQRGVRDECLSDAQVAGEAFVAGSFLGLRIAIAMMTAMRHLRHIAGSGMHFHRLLMYLTRRHRHRHCRQPLQGETNQYREQCHQSA